MFFQFYFKLTVSVDFSNDFIQDLFSGGNTQHGENRPDHLGPDTSFLLHIESVESFFKDCNKGLL